jgi:NO-binding membrane sensor protein with MHYT domain
MTVSYDLWMVCVSCVVALLGCFAAPLLAARVQADRGLLWGFVVVPTLGLALWTVHFTALLALRLPASPALDIPLTLLSIEPALVAAAVVLWLRRKGHLEGLRLLAAVVTLTLGVAATRYFGIAALRIVPAVQLDSFTFLASLAAVAGIAYVALHHAEVWLKAASLFRRAAAVLVIAAAVLGVHYASMMAARVTPDPFPRSVPSMSTVMLGYAAAGGVVLLLIAAYAVALLQERSVRSQMMRDRGFAN